MIQKMKIMRPKIKFNLPGFDFFSQSKIYEGLVLSQKLTYTVENNVQYERLYNNSRDLYEKHRNDKFVNRMLLSSIFSRIIGSSLSLSIYLSQKVQVLRQVPLYTQIQGRVTISEDLGKHKFLLTTQAFGKDQNGEMIQYLAGQAKIMLKV